MENHGKEGSFREYAVRLGSEENGFDSGKVRIDIFDDGAMICSLGFHEAGTFEAMGKIDKEVLSIVFEGKEFVKDILVTVLNEGDLWKEGDSLDYWSQGGGRFNYTLH